MPSRGRNGVLFARGEFRLLDLVKPFIYFFNVRKVAGEGRGEGHGEIVGDGSGSGEGGDGDGNEVEIEED